jgi:hypothetical protein
LPGSIFTREAPFAYVLFAHWLEEIHVPFACRTAARKIPPPHFTES